MEGCPCKLKFQTLKLDFEFNPPIVPPQSRHIAHYIFVPDPSAPNGWSPQLIVPPPFTECTQVRLP